MIRFLSISLTFAVLTLTLISCSNDDNKPKKFYNGYIPSFSVSVPPPTSMTKFNKTLQDSPFLALEVSDTPAGQPVYCTFHLENDNEAPIFPNTAQSTDVAICLGESTDPSYCNTKFGLLHKLYTTSQFYDCNIRKQLRGDPLTTDCRLRVGDGTQSSYGDGDLCDDTVTTTPYQLLVADREGQTHERFAGWSIDPNNPSTSSVAGRMVNNYQDSKTRVDLTRKDGLKTIFTTIVTPSSESTSFMRRTIFVEKDPGSTGSATDHYVVARWWHSAYQKILAIKAHYKAGAGASIFTETCNTITTQTAALAATCQVPNNATPTYFNPQGQVVANAPSGVLSSSSTIAPDIATGEDKFYGSQATDEDVFFNPDSFSPPNEDNSY